MFTNFYSRKQGLFIMPYLVIFLMFLFSIVPYIWHYYSLFWLVLGFASGGLTSRLWENYINNNLLDKYFPGKYL